MIGLLELLRGRKEFLDGVKKKLRRSVQVRKGNGCEIIPALVY